MIVWISLIGGIIIGWLIEWLIDWIYWRRGAEAFYQAEMALRRELTAAQDAAQAAQTEAAALRAQLIELGSAPLTEAEVDPSATETVDEGA